MKSALSKAGSLLIVDDEDDIRELLVDALLPHFGEVFTASDGVEALRILATRTIDVVVSDWKMPNLGGEGLLKQVKADYPFTPVVVITGNLEPKIEESIFSQGAFDFIGKPFSFELVKNRVQNALLYSLLMDLVWASLKQQGNLEILKSFVSADLKDQIAILAAQAELMRLKGNVVKRASNE